MKVDVTREEDLLVGVAEVVVSSVVSGAFVVVELGGLEVVVGVLVLDSSELVVVGLLVDVGFWLLVEVLGGEDVVEVELF